MPPLLILLLTVATYASVWNGKADTKWYKDSESEFTITTPEQLAGLAKLVNKGNDFKGKTIKLGANIMLNDTANWQSWASSPPANEWVPIGRENSSFNGIFDGNEFTVSGVYVNSTKDYQGFFGYVGSSGAIKKLGAVASYIKGKSNIGGLVGANYGSMISNSYFVGMVTGEGGLVGFNGKESTIINSYFSGEVIGKINGIGGFVGANLGTIINSNSSGKVIGEDGIGGLAGWNLGTVISSHSTSTVTGKREVGGLIGKNGIDKKVFSSYSTGAVTGEEDVGGLVGYNEGTISNSYFSDDVTGKFVVGGLVGKNNGLIVNSYSIGAVAGKENAGGLIGHNFGTVSNSHYNGQTSKQSKSIGKDGDRYLLVFRVKAKSMVQSKVKLQRRCKARNLWIA